MHILLSTEPLDKRICKVNTKYEQYHCLQRHSSVSARSKAEVGTPLYVYILICAFVTQNRHERHEQNFHDTRLCNVRLIGKLTFKADIVSTR